MLARLNRNLERHASLPLLVCLLAVALPVLGMLNFADLPFSIPRLKALSGGLGILDLELFYTADVAYRHLDAYGPEGRSLYAGGLLTVDILLPLLMSLTLAVALTLLRRRPANRGWPAWLQMLPLLMLLTDYLENAAILALLTAYPQRLPALATLAGLFTCAKQVCFLACLLLIAVGSLRRNRQ